MYGLTPFENNFNLFNAFNDFDKDFFGGSMPMKSCRTDIRDEGEKYVMEAELPGFDKDDISLDINGNCLSIKAEHKTENEEKEKKFIAIIAYKATEKTNLKIEESEIDKLLQRLLSLENPFTYPYGRPSAIKMTRYDLERKFSRR